MLIRAHDCYTLSCSVFGIAEVLRVARDITNALYQGHHYKLMVCPSVCLFVCLSVCLSIYLSLSVMLSCLSVAQVRLLTGVGRFNEMGYIFKLLLECDEFEALVHPGVEKVWHLIQQTTPTNYSDYLMYWG